MTIDVKKVRKDLVAEQQRLAAELAQTSDSASEEKREGSPFGKREEEATETLELEKRLALENRLRGEMAKIERALAKIDEGTYGLCDSCGEPIDPARLEALPRATLCLNCKAQQAKNAHGRPPTG